MSFLPINIVFPALTARPLGISVISKHLTFPTRSFGFNLKALSKRFEIIGEALLAATICSITGVVVGENRAILTRALGIVFVAKFQRFIKVLVE